MAHLELGNGSASIVRSPLMGVLHVSKLISYASRGKGIAGCKVDILDDIILTLGGDPNEFNDASSAMRARATSFATGASASALVPQSQEGSDTGTPTPSPITGFTRPLMHVSTSRRRGILKGSWSKALEDNARRACRQFFFECNLSFNITHHDAFLKFYKVVGEVSITFKPPSSKTLQSKELRAEVAEVEELEPLKAAWKKYSCTIFFDGWSDARSGLAWPKSTSPKAENFEATIFDSSFWHDAECIAGVLRPLIIALRLTDFEGCTMGILYEFMAKVGEAFDSNTWLDSTREYVTGFRKRKKKRRKIAEKEKKVKEREVRLQKRKEKRLALREALGIPSKGATETTQEEREEIEDDEDAEENQHLVKASMVYENSEMMTIVNTCPIKGNEHLEDCYPLKEGFISQDKKPIKKGHGTASQDKKPNKKVPKKNPARSSNFKKKKKGGTKRNKRKRG